MEAFKAGNLYQIVVQDLHLVRFFPELKLRAEFEALVVEEEGRAISRVKLANGKIIDVKDEGAGTNDEYWCLFNIAMNELAEIKDFTAATIDMFNGQKISTALYSTAGQENCDDEEYDLMQAAADYIVWLEKQLAFSDRPF